MPGSTKHTKGSKSQLTSYKLSYIQKMENNSETGKSNGKRTEKVATDESNYNTPRKKLRSQKPDIIVSVGSGDNKQEFECYRFILCYGCDYFDTMLSHSLCETETSRIEFPDKDPEDWKLFLTSLIPTLQQLQK